MDNLYGQLMTTHDIEEKVKGFDQLNQDLDDMIILNYSVITLSVYTSHNYIDGCMSNCPHIQHGTKFDYF